MAILFVDNLGRRFIMLRTLPGCAVCMCILGAGMWLINSNSDNGQWVAQVGIFMYLAFFSIGMSATHGR